MVLVIDDDPDLLELTTEAIRRFTGRSVLSFSSFQDVLDSEEKVLACRIAIIDINLGTGRPTGVDICKWLIENHFEGKIYFLTGYASVHPDVIAASKIENALVLNKPISIENFLTILEGP